MKVKEALPFAGQDSSAVMTECSLQDHPPGKEPLSHPRFLSSEMVQGRQEGQLGDDNQLFAPDELKLEIQTQDSWNSCEREAWRGYLVSLLLTLIPGTY